MAVIAISALTPKSQQMCGYGKCLSVEPIDALPALSRVNSSAAPMPVLLCPYAKTGAIPVSAERLRPSASVRLRLRAPPLPLIASSA